MTVDLRTERAITAYFGGETEELPAQVARLKGTGFLSVASRGWSETPIGEALGYRDTDQEVKEVVRRILAFVRDGGDLNQRDKYGQPVLFGAFDSKIFTLAVECGADPNWRDLEGRSCWRALVSQLNTPVCNDLAEKTIPVLAECMRLTGWKDNLETRRELMAFESLVSCHWPIDGNGGHRWDELWGKEVQTAVKAARPSSAIADLYRHAYVQGLLFLNLPCYHSGRQYWEAQKPHLPAHRVWRQTPPLFGILLLCSPNGRALLREWISKGKIDPSIPNKDGRNMLYAAVLADAGEEFCKFLEGNGAALDWSKESTTAKPHVVMSPKQRHLVAAAKVAPTPFEVGMLLTLWLRSYGDCLYPFWKEQIERVGFANLLVLDHDAVDVAKILSSASVAALGQSEREKAIFTLWTDPRAPEYHDAFGDVECYLRSCVPSSDTSEREMVLSKIAWKSGLFAAALKEEPYRWVSAFRKLVPCREDVESLTHEALAVYRQLLLAYHANLRTVDRWEQKKQEEAFHAIDLNAFLALCCERGALGPLIPELVWEKAWCVMAKKRGWELADALYQKPEMARQIAANYLSADSIELRKEGRSLHRFSQLAVPFVIGFAEDYSHVFNRKYDLRALHKEAADGVEDIPMAVEVLSELEVEKVHAFALGHILFFPSTQPTVLRAYRFCRPGESTYVQVLERLTSKVYRQHFSGPFALGGGFFWVKEVPGWVKKHLKDHIKPHGPYLVSTYAVEAEQLERLTDPALGEERFQALRSQILDTEVELILSGVDQRASLGSDILLLDMLHLRVEDKGMHREQRRYRFPIGDSRPIVRHQGGARSSEQKEHHPLDDRLVGHSSWILPMQYQWDHEAVCESEYARLCEDHEVVHNGSYAKARRCMNRIARLLRQDGRWLIERLKVRSAVDYRDKSCVSWLATELERGVARVLTRFSGREEQSVHFCREGPFHWEQAARQLAYWNMAPRPELPKDLYPAHVTVEADSAWDGTEGPEPCLALEEMWYHASFFGYVLGHKI